MTYSKSTSRYGIPYMRNGDTMNETDEATAHTIMDNQVRAGVAATPVGVIKEGSFSIINNVTSVDVVLSPAGGPSVQGIINYGLVESLSTIVWTGLTDPNFYYLYLIGGSNLYVNPADFTTQASTTLLPTLDINSMLLATYDATGGLPGTLDTSPLQKISIPNYLLHPQITTDPHSPDLTQTNLTVTNNLDVSLGLNETMSVQQINASATGPILEITQAGNTVPVAINNSGTAADIQSVNELTFQDTRSTVPLSETGQATFDTTAQSIVGSVNEIHGEVDTNTANIATNTSNISTNTTNIGTNTSDIATLQTDVLNSNNKTIRAISNDGSHKAVSGNNNVNTFVEFDLTDGIVYHRCEPQASNQDIDIILRFPLPSYFTAFAATNAMTFFAKADNVSLGVPDPSVTLIKITDSTGTDQTAGLPAAVTSGTLTQIDVPTSSLTGTYNPSTYFYVHFRLFGHIGDTLYLDADRVWANLFVTP